MSAKSTSRWVYVATGCGVVIALGVLMAAGLAFFGIRAVRELERDLEDPSRRLARAVENLGVEELPEGYFAVVGLSIPFLLEVTVLSDREPDESGRLEGFDRAGFIYLRLRNFGDMATELRSFFEGGTGDAQALREANIDLDLREELVRGRIEVSDVNVRWVTFRGTVDLGEMMGSDDFEGLTTMIWPECENDVKVRLGIWFGEEPSPLAQDDPDTVESPAPLAGSVGDPVEIATFLGGVALCS